MALEYNTILWRDNMEKLLVFDVLLLRLGIKLLKPDYKIDIF